MAENPWYAFYVGDYQTKTSHLSLIEHGAYRLLLDHYYGTGHPLPADHAILYRICRVFDRKERKVIDRIVAEFFTREGNIYRNEKCDEEIAKRLKYSESQSAKAKRGHLLRHKPRLEPEHIPGTSPNSARGRVPQPQPQESTAGGDAALRSEFGKVFGYITERFPALMTKNSSIVYSWLDGGYTFERHIKPAVDRTMANGVAPSSFSYFTPAITEARKPVPQAKAEPVKSARMTILPGDRRRMPDGNIITEAEYQRRMMEGISDSIAN